MYNVRRRRRRRWDDSGRRVGGGLWPRCGRNDANSVSCSALEARLTGPYCFFHSKRRLSEMPNSELICRADLPLFSHMATVSSLKRGSNFRRRLAGTPSVARFTRRRRLWRGKQNVCVAAQRPKIVAKNASNLDVEVRLPDLGAAVGGAK